MDTALAPLAAILELNTDLVLNCLDGVSDEEARRRPGGAGNSLAFLTAHLTDSRHFLVDRLGHALSNPLAALLAEARGIEDIAVWPSLTEQREAWAAIGLHLTATLSSLSAEDLARADLHRFPFPDRTGLGLVAFLTQHDSYHLGQMALLRRQLGHPAMRYTRRPRHSAAERA